MADIILGPVSWDRMIQAVESVRQRLHRATSVLEAARIPYAVVGGNAVAAWVSRVDRAAIRNTQDVDLLLRREDLERAKEALAAVGFVYHFSFGGDMFLESSSASPRDSVHIVFAREKVKADDLEPTPDIEASEPTTEFQLLNLEALVRMKLTSHRRKDQVHIQDLIGVGLIDHSWLERLPPELAARLNELLDDPTG